MEAMYKSYNGFQIVQELVKLRWVPEILKSIEHENKRYSEILGCIPYLSHTELNRKLTILMQKKVIEKRSHEGIIYYSLLGFGKDLVHIFNHLENLEEKYCVRL
jgi:DNA-binding HxlR family transcriptional regulator